MKKFLDFKIEKELKGTLARAGVLKTPHGEIKTPSFVVVGTKGTVKSVLPESLEGNETQVVLAYLSFIFTTRRRVSKKSWRLA